MQNKINKAQKVILFVFLALVVTVIPDYKGIHLGFWQRIVFILLPVLLIVDFVIGRILKDQL